MTDWARVGPTLNGRACLSSTASLIAATQSRAHCQVPAKAARYIERLQLDADVGRPAKAGRYMDVGLTSASVLVVLALTGALFRNPVSAHVAIVRHLIPAVPRCDQPDSGSGNGDAEGNPPSIHMCFVSLVV